MIRYAHLYGSQCNLLLHSAPTRYGHSEPPSLGMPLSPDPPMDCPARCHLRWLKHCLSCAHITKPDSRFWIFIKSAKLWQIIFGAYQVLRQRTWQHRGVHGNRAEPAPLSSRGWSCRCSSLSHRPRIRGSLHWPMSATPYWLSGGNTQKGVIAKGKHLWLKYSRFMQWIWYRQTHPLVTDETNHDEKRHAKKWVNPCPVHT